MPETAATVSSSGPTFSLPPARRPPSSLAAFSVRTTRPWAGRAPAGARRPPGSTPKTETAAVRSPETALVVRMPSGSAAVTPGRARQVSQALSVSWELVKETFWSPVGAAKASREAGRPVMAETFSRARPEVRPDSRPTSSVISRTTEPMRAKRPLANRRSLHATNMFPTLVVRVGTGHRATVGILVSKVRSRHQTFG